MSEKPKKKIHTFPGSMRSPKVLLHQLLEFEEDIEAVVAVVKWKAKDNYVYFVPYTSKIELGDLCATSVVLNDIATRELRGDCEECSE